MDKNFAIDVSGCSQEQIEGMADWLCDKFGLPLGDISTDDIYCILKDSSSCIFIGADRLCQRNKTTYNQALEIMQSEQNEYKEQNAHKADIAMGEAIDQMDKAGHDVQGALEKVLDDTWASLANKDEKCMIKKPNHYQLLPEYEVKDINKALLDKIEESNFDMTLYEAGWYQQAMQYFMRFYAKNGIEDLKKGIETMQFAIDSMENK